MAILDKSYNKNLATASSEHLETYHANYIDSPKDNIEVYLSN